MITRDRHLGASLGPQSASQELFVFLSWALLRHMYQNLISFRDCLSYEFERPSAALYLDTEWFDGCWQLLICTHKMGNDYMHD